MNAEEDLFVLLHSIMKRMRTIANKELAPFGISHAEMRILMMMYLYHSDGCSQEELISKLEVDRSNVGRALKKLEQLRYIERARDTTDRRAYRVFLTEKGESLREHLLDMRKTLHCTFTRAMTHQELTALLHLLHKTDQYVCEETYRSIKQEEVSS